MGSLEIGYLSDEADKAQALAMLARVYERDRALDPVEIEVALASDEMQLIAIRKGGDQGLLAAAVVRSALYRDGEWLEIIAAAGMDYKQWASWGMGALRKAAQEAGMKGIAMLGRGGWQRVFPHAVRDGEALKVAA